MQYIEQHNKVAHKDQRQPDQQQQLLEQFVANQHHQDEHRYLDIKITL